MFIIKFGYYAPTIGVQSIVISVICMSVCLLLAYLRNHFQISPNFLYMLPEAVARFSSDGNVMCYVLPILCMMSCFQFLNNEVNGPE